jgi:hypothetical protein
MSNFVGDIGANIILCFKAKDCNGVIQDFDISAATDITICITRPDGTTVEATGLAFAGAPCGNGTGTDGKATYPTIVTDFNQPGTYNVSGKYTSASQTLRSKDSEILVKVPTCS